MRIYKNKILIALGLIGIFAGCKKQETFPINHVSIQYVFDPRDSAGTNAQKYLYNIYTVVKVGYDRVGGNYLDAASDDAISSATGAQQVTLLATGAYSSVNLPSNEDVWTVTKTSGLNDDTTATSSYWSGIRYANEFVNNIGVVPVKGSLPNGVGTRWVWQSEARFLRAYFYFELVKRFGGVPLLGNNVYQATDNLQLSRNTFSDCIKYIVNECDAIKDSLITVQDYNSSQDGYRATQGAALALKAKALLYAASPLFNDPTGSNSNPYVGYTNYDPTRWNAAAQAALDVINLNGYALYPSFGNIFTTQAVNGNKELIFIRPNGTPGTGIESDDAPVGYGQAIGEGIVSPTQELVNAFPMINGKAITDPTSGYDPQNPYKDRDPRFGATILYNGATWLSNPLQTYNGGASRLLNGQLETQTGYYLNKFMNPLDSTGSKFVPHYSDWTVMRYAEILLDYAEAENEVAGPTPAVLNQIYAIRARAGIAAGSDNTYGLGTVPDQATMRGIIQNERRIELAFEEERFFDIRRWKLAPTLFAQGLHGVSITNSNGNLSYAYPQVLSVNFIAPKMYLYPIPYAQVVEDPNLKQNPGW
jgi:starch-binding outer membrane protein, SusD/RagB family